MGNMSYCRFENTLEDLEDCYENMDNADLSDSESRCRKRLLKFCANIASDFGDELED